MLWCWLVGHKYLQKKTVGEYQYLHRWHRCFRCGRLPKDYQVKPPIKHKASCHGPIGELQCEGEPHD